MGGGSGDSGGEHVRSDGETSEEGLAQRACAGDDEALCVLLDRHEALLRGRIAQLLPPYIRRRLSVSDVLQEARLVAVAKREAFEWRGDGSFRAWLLAIAENKARRAVQTHRDVGLRSVRREVTRARRLGTHQYAARQPTPSEAAMAAEVARFAREAMEALPQDYREVLRLHREEELPLQEVALRIGRSYDATRKLYGRSLKRFIQIFNRLRGERDEH